MTNYERQETMFDEKLWWEEAEEESINFMDFPESSISKLFDEIERLEKTVPLDLRAAESALISMVQQYCYRPLDVNREPAVNVYQHDFMSAGEEAFAYLVEHGLAQWTDDGKHSIVLTEGGEE